MSLEHPIDGDIKELTAIRNESRYWTIGGLVAIVAILAVCVVIVSNDVQRLFKPGPAQDEFTSYLSSDLSTSVLPAVQTIASQALTQSQPAIQVEFTKLKTRMPDVSSAFMNQFELMQQDLPAQGSKIIDNTYGKTLTGMDANIRQMYPDVTEDNVSSLTDKITSESQDQINQDALTLFAPHEKALTGIMADMTKIGNTEPVAANEDTANLQMAVTVVGVFNNGLQDANAAANATTSAKEHKN